MQNVSQISSLLQRKTLVLVSVQYGVLPILYFRTKIVQLPTRIVDKQMEHPQTCCACKYTLFRPDKFVRQISIIATKVNKPGECHVGIPRDRHEKHMHEIALRVSKCKLIRRWLHARTTVVRPPILIIITKSQHIFIIESTSRRLYLQHPATINYDSSVDLR